MIEQKSITKIFICCITLLLLSSCMMDKKDCRLKIINKTPSNYGVVDWTYYADDPIPSGKCGSV